MMGERKLRAQPAEIENPIQLAQQVIGGNPILQTKLIEKSILLTRSALQPHRLPVGRSGTYDSDVADRLLLFDPLRAAALPRDRVEFGVPMVLPAW